MKTFENLDFIKIDEPPYMVGVKARLSFDNGYGVSVISHSYSYGGRDGLFEVAVLDSNDDITYDTPITNDVIGYLTTDDVTEIMEQVQKL